MEFYSSLFFGTCVFACVCAVGYFFTRKLNKAAKDRIWKKVLAAAAIPVLLSIFINLPSVGYLPNEPSEGTIDQSRITSDEALRARVDILSRDVELLRAKVHEMNSFYRNLCEFGLLFALVFCLNLIVTFEEIGRDEVEKRPLGLGSQ